MAEQNFIDYVKIHCKSGHGGAGSSHFYRDTFTSTGGPDGGDGGRGAHIIARGNKQMWTLLHLKYRKHVLGADGARGHKQRSTGKNGSDVILDVPIGTLIKDFETQDILGEIMEDGQEIILKRGGRGGLGNSHFKSSTNQTPLKAQPGEEGSEGWIIMELKVLADVGLVGFPNAGKSTLLSVISSAKPEIADYAFTTLVPHLGVVKYKGFNSFIIADIPGIIEGAHEGKGLGHRFLRHIERNATLLFMIPADSVDHKKEYKILLNELKAYNPDLLDKQHIIAISKSDMLDEELKSHIKKSMRELKIIFISSVTGEGINNLKDILWNTLNT